MHSPYRIIQSSNTHTGKQRLRKTDHDLKITSNDSKVISNDLKETSKEPAESNRKSKLKIGDINDDNHSSGRDFIEQAFSSN